MTQFEQEQAAKRFVEIWKDKGNERSDAQKFLIQLLREVYGVKDSEQYIDFELPVKIKNTSFADGFIADTKILIEMKGKDIDLTKPERQSDGSMLTPYQQAKRYADELVYDKGVRWIIVSNFKEIHIYDMKKRHQEPEIILLKELPKYYYVLQILVNDKEENIKKEEQISKKAGDIIGKIYDVVKPLYENPDDDETLKNLNKLCVRLVFCLYAEDAGLFGTRLMFHDYLNKYNPEDLREALISLFDVLNTEEDKRNPYIKEELKVFPYVNGGLFDGEIEIPRLNAEFKTLLLEKASEDFDWTEISPTIFGGVFESTLNQETRRKGGMHYTSVENIRKVTRPLFLDSLQYEFEKIKNESIIRKKKEKLYELQEKLSNLKFLDPACGSGNFLTQTYLDLREIENNIIKELVRIDKRQLENQIQIGVHIANPIKVSINQFYGIEINDFAVAVAKTALWIAEHQMFEKTRAITFMKEDFLPLKTYTNIVEGNALRLNWNDIIPNTQCNYIMGNPPFIGARMMEQGGKQKKDIEELFGNIKDVQDLDYVTGWYKKAAEYIQNTNIEVGYVSTDSITCGTQVGILWPLMINDYDIRINFAYKSFKWMSESLNKAQIYCVIIGFATFNRNKKYLFSNGTKKECKNINPYLIDYDNVYIYSRTKPLCDIPEVVNGNMERGGVNLILSDEEKNEIIQQEPYIEKYIKPFYGSDEFLSGKKRWCIWLVGAPFSDIRNSKILMDRIEKVKEHRLNSKAKTTRQYANDPTVFAQRPQPDGVDWLIIPRVSAKGTYIPFGFMTKNDIASDKVHCMPNATLYHFGVLESNVHMAWTRAISMRMGDGYSYSRDIVYNNFPWPTPTKEQKMKIEETARTILNTRLKHSDLSIRQMYGTILPPDLKAAHVENDKAVMAAYGFNHTKMSETECVAELMKMYQDLIEKK